MIHERVRVLLAALCLASICADGVSSEDCALMQGASNFAGSSKFPVLCPFSPFNSQHTVSKMQSVYLKSDLNAAGLSQGDSITSVGFMIGAANVGSFQSAAPSLNNVRVSSAWLPSSLQPVLDGVPMRTWGSSTNTFKYNAGLDLNSKVSLSTALLPAANGRQWITLDTPIVWDGQRHLLLEYSMENDQTSSLDKTCINFKFASKQTSNSINDYARTVYGYIYYDSCWASQSYPWSEVATVCSYKGKSMEASGMTGVVMDVAFRIAGVCNVPTTTTKTTTTKATQKTTTKTTTTANGRLVNTTTTPAGGATTATSSTPPRNSNNNGKKQATVFGVLALLLLFCCMGLLFAYLRLKNEKDKAAAGEGNSTYSNVTSDQVGLVGGGDDDSTNI